MYNDRVERAGIRKNKKIFFLTYIPDNAIMQLEINKGDKICGYQ